MDFMFRRLIMTEIQKTVREKKERSERNEERKKESKQIDEKILY